MLARNYIPISTNIAQPSIIMLKHSPFLVLSHQSDVRLALSTSLRLTRMLRAIKHIYFSGNSLRRDQVGVLGHITRSVDFALMVDFLDDLDAWLGWYGVATEFSSFVVIVRAIETV